MLKAILRSSTAFILIFTLLFSNFSLDVFAEEEIISLNLETRLASEVQTYTSNDKALIKSISTQLKNLNPTVDIYSFRLVANEENIQKIVYILSYEVHECFHIERNFSITSSKEGYISTIIPQYGYTKTEYKKMLSKCEDVADKMLNGIEGNSKLSDVEKLLILHDRIALACEYDYERYEMGTVPQISHTLYGVFGNGIAVCQGYAIAYAYLLDRIGIENYFCDSDTLYHVWNIVYVNGKAYHVDITWDDNPWDVTGKVTHDNFLVSTKKLIQNGHTANDFDTTPSSTTYDNYFWQNSQAAFTLLNDEIYYIDSKTVKNKQYVLINRYSDRKTVYQTEHYWMGSANGYWTGNYARLCSDGVNLLFSLSDGIYSFNPKTQKSEKILSKPYLNGYFNIYGFTYTDGMLIYDLSDHPVFDNLTKALYEYKTPYTPPLTYTPGNLNDDGFVDLQDVSSLAKILAGWQVTVNNDALDVNGDGSQNLKDLIHLSRYVAGWEGIVLH